MEVSGASVTAAMESSSGHGRPEPLGLASGRTGTCPGAGEVMAASFRRQSRMGLPESIAITNGNGRYTHTFAAARMITTHIPADGWTTLTTRKKYLGSNRT